MHDPIRLLAMGCSTLVKDKSFSHSNTFGIAVDNLISTGGFPESGSSGTVGSGSGRVLLVFVAKEVPVVLWGGSDFTSLCKIQYMHKNSYQEEVVIHVEL